MGLAQKRIIKEFQETAYPEWHKKMIAALGFEVPIEVKWDTWSRDNIERKDQYFNWSEKVFFQPITETFKNICADAMGKEALQAALKKVVIESSDEYSSYKGTTFENGVLHIKHSFSNVDSINDRIKGWTALLESKL